MKNMLIAKRYSKALLALISKDVEQEFLNEIKLLKNAVLNNSDFMDFIDSKIIKIQTKLDLINVVIKDFSNKDIWKEFFQILLEKQRQFILPQILEILENEILKNRGIVKINLKIAKKHNKESIKKISEYVENFLNKKIEINEIIDPNIIGGFIAEGDKYLIDCSVRNNLEKLQSVLKN